MNSDTGSQSIPTAVFALTHPWVQSVIREVGAEVAPEMRILFLDLDDAEQMAQLLPQAHFLVTLKLTPSSIPLLRQCRLVQANGVGVDAIDTTGLRAAGIPLAISPQLTAVGVAEHTILMILALSKQLLPVHESMRQGRFQMFAWRQHSHTFHGKTLGIVGLGRIGRQVAQLAYAFGAKVIYHDLVRAPQALAEQLALTPVSFGEALSRAEILTVHVPLTPLTAGMFGRDEFRQLRPGALFINTSRGGTTDLDALYEALVSGHLSGAGLDVYAPEPPPVDHPIMQLPQVICTPHMASGTSERHRAIAAAQFANFRRVWEGLSPQDIV